jgi:hypothetical protein
MVIPANWQQVFGLKFQKEDWFIGTNKHKEYMKAILYGYYSSFIHLFSASLPILIKGPLVLNL